MRSRPKERLKCTFHHSYRHIPVRRGDYSALSMEAKESSHHRPTDRLTALCSTPQEIYSKSSSYHSDEDTLLAETMCFQKSIGINQSICSDLESTGDTSAKRSRSISSLAGVNIVCEDTRRKECISCLMGAGYDLSWKSFLARLTLTHNLEDLIRIMIANIRSEYRSVPEIRGFQRLFLEFYSLGRCYH